MIFETLTNGLAVKVVPFKATFNDTDFSTKLRVIITNDNLLSGAQLFWEALTDTNVKKTSGVLNIKETNYTNYLSDRMYAFTFATTQLELTLATQSGTQSGS